MAPTNVEAVRAEFRRYRRLLELAVEQIDDEAFFDLVDAEGNSIAIIIQHLAGNLKSRFTDFLTTDGEKPWRGRDGEFENPGRDRAGLLGSMRESWAIVDAALDEVEAEDAWLSSITIRRQPLTVMEALYRSLAHHAYHVGQIVLLARTAAGESWTSLSVPKGKSRAYEANPTREKTPDGT